MGTGGAGHFVIGRGPAQIAAQQQIGQAVVVAVNQRPLIAQAGHLHLRPLPGVGQPDDRADEQQGNEQQVQPVEQRQRPPLLGHELDA